MRKTIGIICAVLTVFFVMPCTIALTVSGSEAEHGNVGFRDKLVISSQNQSPYGTVLVNYDDKSGGGYFSGNTAEKPTDKEPANNANDDEKAGDKSDTEPKKDLLINVYFAKENITKEVYLEDYIAGVILGEIYAYFELETLKAQAVAARSYTLFMLKHGESGYHEGGAVICTDYTHCQSYKSPESLFEAYPEELAEEYYEKLYKAVNDTKGLVMAYEGEIVKAYYFDNSGGFTESSENVWGGNLGYTQSVPCMGEADKDNFCTLSYFDAEDFLERFKNADERVEANVDNVFDTVKILSRTDSNRIDEIEVGGVVFKGTAMRSILGLKSTNVIFREIEDGRIMAVTFGSGHGVGMSQWGAQAMAEKGSTFEEILKYYYKDIELVDYKELL